MSFSMTADAAKWFKDEFNLGAGDYLQFYIKIYGGIPTPRDSYFLGIKAGEKGQSSLTAVAEGVSFYFNEADSWFLEDYDLEIALADGEARYNFTPQEK